MHIPNNNNNSNNNNIDENLRTRRDMTQQEISAPKLETRKA